MAENPFVQLFETLGRSSVATSSLVNERAFDDLRGLFERAHTSGHGVQVLLRAPRAGFGKTHLISRVAATREGAEFISLPLVGGQSLTAKSVAEELVAQLLRSSAGEDDETTVIDELARKAFSKALAPLVEAGDVPCEDRDIALRSLAEAPVQTFDFHDDGALTAHWAKENFRVLGPRLATHVARIYDMAPRDADFWVQALFDYASAPADKARRNAELLNEVTGHFEASSEARKLDLLGAWINLISQELQLVLVVDETEALSAAPVEALALANFLQLLRQHSPRCSVLFSVNGDVWETGFRPRLPGGLKDRICEHTISLRALDDSEVADLVSSRVDDKGLANAILAELEEIDGVRYARRIVRKAGEIWEEKAADFTDEAPEAFAEVAPAPEAESEDNEISDEDWADDFDKEDSSTLEPEDSAKKTTAVAKAAAISDLVANLASPSPTAEAPGDKEALADSSAEDEKEPAAPTSGVAIGLPTPTQPAEPVAIGSVVEPSADVTPAPADPVEFAPAPEEPVKPEPASQEEPAPVTSPFTVAPISEMAPRIPEEVPVSQVVPPQAVFDSPFSIAAEPEPATPLPVQPVVAPQPMSPMGAVHEQPPEAIPAPTAEPIPRVTEEDQMKVDSLLRQFRERREQGSEDDY